MLPLSFYLQDKGLKWYEDAQKDPTSASLEMVPSQVLCVIFVFQTCCCVYCCDSSTLDLNGLNVVNN